MDDLVEMQERMKAYGGLSLRARLRIAMRAYARAARARTLFGAYSDALGMLGCAAMSLAGFAGAYIVAGAYAEGWGKPGALPHVELGWAIVAAFSTWGWVVFAGVVAGLMSIGEGRGLQREEAIYRWSRNKARGWKERRVGPMKAMGLGHGSIVCAELEREGVYAQAEWADLKRVAGRGAQRTSSRKRL